MQSLYDYISEIYNRLRSGKYVLKGSSLNIINSNSFDKMISDDDLCIDLINRVLQFESTLTKTNRNRASHTLVTWLLGIGLGEYFGLNHVDGEFGIRNYQRLWLQSAMLHDYGYFRREVSADLANIDDILKPYSLLVDEYDFAFLKCLNDLRTNEEYSQFFTYEYDEIKKYFKYSQELHSLSNVKKGAEKRDHGIIGGCVAFKKYCKAIEKSKMKDDSEITRIYKIACIIAASHNIFKSSGDEYDEKYQEYGLDNLLSTSPIRINEHNKLLLLLSLVDTIECTKRFSAKENPKEYLHQKTTLKYVNIDFEDHRVNLDFSPLSNYTLNKRKSEEMQAKVRNHVKAIASMSSWTSVHTNNPDKNNTNIVSIEYY